LAPTVGIAATGFCYPGGILQQVFHRQDQQVFHRQDQQIFSSTRSAKFAAADEAAAATSAKFFNNNNKIIDNSKIVGG
jgi:hypothetical protein